MKGIIFDNDGNRVAGNNPEPDYQTSAEYVYCPTCKAFWGMKAYGSGQEPKDHTCKQCGSSVGVW